MRKLVVLILSLWVLSTVLYIPLAVGGDPVLNVDIPVESKPKISFQPNVIPNLTITEMGDKSFHFEWYHNYFDLKLYINSETSLDSFGVSSKCAITSITKREMSHVEFGYNITNIPIEISENVEYLLWKIEGASFDTSENSTEIELEEIDTFFELGYNITNIRLPDNLMLSYKDLQLYNFTVSHPFKTETIVKGEGLKKSSWNLDPITFSSPYLVVTGFSAGTPCTFWDLWNASNVNGWNVVWNNQNNNTQYQFDTRIIIGQGSDTWFIDKNVQVTFADDIVTATQYIIIVREKGHFWLGNIVDETEQTSDQGVSIISLNDVANIYLIRGWTSGGNTDDVRLYSCQFVAPYTAPASGSYRHYLYDLHEARIWNCIFTSAISPYLLNANISRTTIESTQFGLLDVSGNLGDIVISHTKYGVYASGSTAFTLSDSKVYDSTNPFWFYVRTTDAYLINVESDSWTFGWGGISSAEWYRQYTFDLTVTTASNGPIENANVTLTYYGQGGGTHGTWLTDANGEIPEQTVTAGFYNQTGGNTIYTYNPYEITITKAGYLTYQRNFTQLEAKSWNIALLEETGYNWFAATIIIALFACFMTVYALTGKT